MPKSIERLLSPEYLANLGTLTMEELRQRRQDCSEVENGLSYYRRLIQGRLDIVHAEMARRAGGVAATDLAGLVEQLPAILAERGGGGSRGPLPDVVAPAGIETMSGQLDEIVDADRLASLPDESEAELRNVANALSTLERTVSSQRRDLFEQIDTLQEEIVRRYKTGEATVDALLR
jgi:hypothetical protein